MIPGLLVWAIDEVAIYKDGEPERAGLAGEWE